MAQVEAHDGIRTHDPVLTKNVLYRLSYVGIPRLLVWSGDEGARTPNPRLAKAVLSQLSYIPNSTELTNQWAG